MGQYEKEKFSFEEYSFEALEFIVCRYYGYLVRVKREGQKDLGEEFYPPNSLKWKKAIPQI